MNYLGWPFIIIGVLIKRGQEDQRREGDVKLEAEFGVMCSSKARNTVSYQKLLRVKEQISPHGLQSESGFQSSAPETVRKML